MKNILHLISVLPSLVTLDTALITDLIISHFFNICTTNCYLQGSSIKFDFPIKLYMGGIINERYL